MVGLQRVVVAVVARLRPRSPSPRAETRTTRAPAAQEAIPRPPRPPRRRRPERAAAPSRRRCPTTLMGCWPSCRRTFRAPTTCCRRPCTPARGPTGSPRVQVPTASTSRRERQHAVHPGHDQGVRRAEGQVEQHREVHDAGLQQQRPDPGPADPAGDPPEVRRADHPASLAAADAPILEEAGKAGIP